MSAAVVVVAVVVGGAEAGSTIGSSAALLATGSSGDDIVGLDTEEEFHKGAETTPAPHMTSNAGPTTSCVSSTISLKLTGNTS